MISGVRLAFNQVKYQLQTLAASAKPSTSQIFEMIVAEYYSPLTPGRQRSIFTRSKLDIDK